MSELVCRPMAPRDIDGVVLVAASAFPDHFESRACFEERLALFPQGCFVAASEEEIAGYLIAYPQELGTIPPLDSLLHGLPAAREALYLHDLALHPAVRGQGLTRPLLDRLVAVARDVGARWLHLVAVNGSVPFWRSMGFTAVEDDPVITAKLRSYGDRSAYMIRDLRADMQ